MRSAVVVALVVSLAACSTSPDVSVSSSPASSTTIASNGANSSSDSAGTEAPTEDVPATTNAPGEPLYGHVDLPGLVPVVTDPIANDDTVATGTLPNGVRYFVKNNDNPGGSAELRLAINAGSVDEQGPTGVAHFVEHMLFNGTEKYPKNELIDVLRGFGAAFGADVNAYTSFDRTVYELDVPARDAPLSTGLDVLAQWLSHATFDPAEVEAERGVVLDEWRSRTQTTRGRLFDIALPLYFGGTPYASRVPIGSDADIQSVTADELRAYYEQWYRPANATVIVVGDVDVQSVVDQIVTLFSDATDPAATEPARPATSIEGVFSDATEPGYALHADPDQPTVDVEIGLPLAAIPADDPLSWQASLYDQMIYDIIVRRLSRAVDDGTAPFDDITPGTNSFTRSMDAPALYAFTDAERSAATMQALLDEYERTARFGFDDRELGIARDGLQGELDTLNEGADSTQDAAYADRIVDHALAGAPYPSIGDEYEIKSAILAAATPDALRQRFLARWTNTSPYMIVSTPVADAESVPTEADFNSAVAGLDARPLDPIAVATDVADQLMTPPTPVEPTDRTRLLPSGGFDVFDPIEFTYPNGVRVIVNPSTIVEGQVYLSATSAGGRSVLELGQIPDAVYASEVVLSSGVGDFTRAELSDVMAAADIDISASIDSYTEGFSGTFATRDADMALAYLHLLMTAPRVDDSAMSKMRAAHEPAVNDPAIDADLAGYDALIDARYGDHSAEMVLPSVEEFATVDGPGIEAVWNDRFSNASDWVFVFSGDVDVDELAGLANSYLGTLPSAGPDRPIVDISGAMPAGVTSQTVQAGTGETAQTTLWFETPLASADAKTQVTMQVANAVIDARLTKVVREEFGESYSPYARLLIDDDPDLVGQAYLSATGAPASVDLLNQLIIEQVTDIAVNGPTADEFDKAYSETVEQYNYVNNGQFLEVLTDATLYPDRGLDTYLGQFAEIENVTAGDVQAYVAAYLPTDQYIQITVVPVG